MGEYICGCIKHILTFSFPLLFFQSEDLRLVIRERDELQSMLDRFEKHMIDIQSNVKLLTVEKDKLSVLYEQVNKYNLDAEQYITMKICSLFKKKLDLLQTPV